MDLGVNGFLFPVLFLSMLFAYAVRYGIACIFVAFFLFFFLGVTALLEQRGSSKLLELTCHMGSRSITCHPAEVTLID